jgi:NinB protein
MNKQTFIINGSRSRECMLVAASAVPDGYVVTISPPKRSLPQNNRMWAMLTDVRKQVNWHDLVLVEEEWKHIFSASLFGQRTVPNLESNGFVVMGKSTKEFTVPVMNDMMELMSAFGSERDIRWSSPEL